MFANLTVDENLLSASRRRAPACQWPSEEMFDFFPQLKDRRNTHAGLLSGGEQQMLTICCALLGNPRVVLIDEPTEGLAPKIVKVVAEVIFDICRKAVVLPAQSRSSPSPCALRSGST